MPGAHLDHVGVFFPKIDARRIERFRHNFQAEGCARLRQDLEAFFAQPCEIVRRTAWFKRAPTQETCTARLDRLCHSARLLTALDRARAGNDRQFLTPNSCIADPQNRPVGLEIERDELVWFTYANRLENTLEGFEA